MQRQIVTVPYSMMCLLERDWWIDWRGQPPAENTSGGTQVVYNAMPRWMGQLSFSYTREKSAAWRALNWAAEGRVGIFRLFLADPLVFVRASVLPSGWATAGVPFSTDQLFSTGSGFDPGPRVPAAEAASAGASSIKVSVTDPRLVPKAGQIISAQDWPMGVKSVSDDGGNIYTLEVVRQRVAIAEGDPIDLVATGLFEAMSDDASRAPYGHARTTQPQMTFREVLNR